MRNQNLGSQASILKNNASRYLTYDDEDLREDHKIRGNKSPINAVPRFEFKQPTPQKVLSPEKQENSDAIDKPGKSRLRNG